MCRVLVANDKTMRSLFNTNDTFGQKVKCLDLIFDLAQFLSWVRMMLSEAVWIRADLRS